MNCVKSTCLSVILLFASIITVFAADGEATVKVGETTNIYIASTFQRTLAMSTNINAQWKSLNSDVTITYQNKNYCTILGNRATTSGRIYYNCSYIIDGFYRTMDLYYDITVTANCVTSIRLSSSSLYLGIGETQSVSATLSPTNASVRWYSDNSSIASVSSSGTKAYITGKSRGVAIITCQAIDDCSLDETCIVEVHEDPIPVTNVTLNKIQETLQLGNTLQLTSTITPSNATNKTVSWESSDTAIASVDSKGLVTAKAAGNATITCMAKDGSNVKVTCQITVTAPTPTGIDINSTNFPDANFRNYLLAQSYGEDGELSEQEINSITYLNINDKNFSSLKGIEYFTKLRYLYASRNKLTSLDVSENTELLTLDCGNNQLTSLDLSNNIALTYLACDTNQLTSLDVSKNIALTKLYCYNNQLTSLNVSKNVSLTLLSCFHNHLSSLDVSKNTELLTLDCKNNQLSSLDLSKNTELTYVSCRINQLTSLDISNNVALTSLWCAYNCLTSLDVSKNTALTKLEIHANMIQGVAMDALLSSLPKNNNETHYNLYVTHIGYSTENNVITERQVIAAKAKGWTPLYYYSDYGEWNEFSGTKTGREVSGTKLITSVSQLSSPYTEMSEGSQGALIDDNPNTFWHSRWNAGSVENGTHYFQVEVPDRALYGILCFQFTRRKTFNDHITEWSVRGTNNFNAAKDDCEELAYIVSPYDFPDCWQETYVSEQFRNIGYKYLRFYAEREYALGENEGRGYFHLAEFQLYQDDTTPIPSTDNALTISEITCSKNQQVALSIALKNKQQITGLQLDLYLPNGVTIATDSRGKLLLTTTSRMDGNYSLSGSQMDGFVRIAGYSTDSDAFTGTEGDILNITLNIANVADGNYTIQMKDIVLSDINNTEYHPDDVSATLTVKSYTQGDVDNSGAININDVVCIINYILNRTSGTFIKEAADVDGSGTININDVVTLINRFILHRTTAPRRAPQVMNSISETTDYLYLNDMIVEPGETYEIAMKLANDNEVKAVQGNIKLPDGFKFVTKSNGRLDVKNLDERSEDFTLSCALQEDGSMTFAHYSANGDAYDGHDGGIFTFKVSVDDSVQHGIYDVSISDVVLSIDGVGYELPNRTSQLIVDPEVGLYSIDCEKLRNSDFVIYNLNGQRVIKPQRGVNIINGKKVIIR